MEDGCIGLDAVCNHCVNHAADGKEQGGTAGRHSVRVYDSQNVKSQVWLHDCGRVDILTSIPLVQPSCSQAGVLEQWKHYAGTSGA
jgi:hypothetical protein